MPIRRDFAERIRAVADSQLDTRDWVSGEWRWVKVVAVPTSSDAGVHGVILKCETPYQDIVWKFVNDLSPLMPQYGAHTIQLWSSMLERSKRALARGDLESPAPDMIQYGPWRRFRYPDIETAISRLWERQVIMLRHADLKTGLQGGNVIDDKPMPVMNIMLDQLRAAYGERIRINHDHGLTVLESGARVIGMVDARHADKLSMPALRNAALAITLQPDNTRAKLQIITERVEELTRAMNDLIMVLRSRGIDVDVIPPIEAASDAVAWLSAANA